jgi:hypothetical protein
VPRELEVPVHPSFLLERPYISDQRLAVYYTVRLYTCLRAVYYTVRLGGMVIDS